MDLKFWDVALDSEDFFGSRMVVKLTFFEGTTFISIDGGFSMFVFKKNSNLVEVTGISL